GPGVTEKGDVAVPLRSSGVSAISIVSPEPALSMIRLVNSASPPLAVAVGLPTNVAPSELRAMDADTRPSKSVARLPDGSSALIWRLNALPAMTLVGGWMTTTNCEAGPAATTMLLVVTAGRPAHETWSV